MKSRIILLFIALGSVPAFSQTQSIPASAVVTDSASYFLQKGLQEKEKGRRMESFKALDKAIKYDPDNKTILAELAAVNMEMRRYNNALENYKKLVELGDATAANYNQLLILSFNFKRNDDVILYAGKLKQVDPSAKVNYYLGKVYYEQENYGEGIKCLEAAAKEDPKNGEIQYLIARSYADMQNYKQSIPYFLKAIDIDTSKNYWIYELGLMYYALHEEKKALEYIKLAGDKGYRKDNDYYQNLAIAYLNVGQLDQGVAVLGEILKKRPTDINILNMIAEAYYAKGRYQQAMDYWDQIIGVDKSNASALYMIGMCYQKKGEKEKGVQLCDKAIQMDPALASLKQKKEMAGF